MATVTSLHHSQKATGDRNGAKTFSDEFLIKGATNKDEAMQALVDYTSEPVEIDGVSMSANGRNLEEMDAGYWKGTVDYALSTLVVRAASGGNTLAGSVSLETEHRTHAEGEVITYPYEGQEVIDFKNAINVINENGVKRVEGDEFPVLVQTLTISKTYPKATVTNDWIRQRSILVGKVNNGSFNGFQRGEARFDGMNFSLSADGIYNVDFNFSMRLNRTGLLIADINVSRLEGWQKYWIYRDERDIGTEDTPILVMFPVQVNVYNNHLGYSDFGLFNQGDNRTYVRQGLA
jgi:hypothetical protein